MNDLKLKFFLLLLLIAALPACTVNPASREHCTLQRIEIASEDPALNRFYLGKAGGYEVRFTNENSPTPAEVFPEPGVSVKNTLTGRQCEIQDGSGIWSGRAVYLDVQRQVLVLNEYSGASDTLVFYSLTTCQRIGELDVSGVRWEVAASHIRTGKDCAGTDVNTCQSIRKIPLNIDCSIRSH